MKFIQESKWWKFYMAIIALEGLSFFFAFVVFDLQNEPCDICQYIDSFGVPLFTLLMLPIVAIEELIFRFLPNFLLSKLNIEKLAIPVNIIVSVIFGFAHGGIESILIQGFGGFAIAMIYLRALKKGHKIAYFECVAYHFIYNASIVIL